MFKGFVVGLVASSMVVLMPSVGHTLPPDRPVGGMPGQDAVNQRFGLIRSELVQLAVDVTPGQPVTVTLPLAEGPWTLRLEPYSVRSPSFRLLERGEGGRLTELKPGVENTLRGMIDEIDGAVVAGGVLPDGLYARALLPDGRDAWIEPIGDRVPGTPPGLHVVYFTHDTLPTGAACRVQHDEFPMVEHEPARSAGEPQPRGAVRYGAALGLEADFTYYEMFGSVTVTSQRMHLIINMMNLQYERDVDIYHYVSLLVVDTVLFYDRNMITEGFRDRWNTEFAGVERDLAMIIVGFGGGGFALPGGRTCNANGQAYCVTQMGGYPGLSYCCDVSAHELGHLWGACHCTCTNPAFTMNGIITNANRFGLTGDECGTNSIAAIIATRNGSQCLVTVGGGNTVRNNACDDALLVEVEPNGEGTYGVSNVGCTRDGPLGSCRAGDSDAWFRYIAPCDGTVTIDTCEASFDTVLIAYASGNCGNLGPGNEVGCNDDVPAPCGSGLSSRISFATNAGAHYLIRLAGYATNQGNCMLRLVQSPCFRPANDNCLQAFTLANGETRSFGTLGATTDGFFEPLCNNAGDQQILNDVWFLYVSPCVGDVLVSLCGSGYDTRLAVYETDCPSAPGNALRCNDDNGPGCVGLASSLIFPARNANIPYYIRVGGYQGAMGSGVIRVESIACPRPANDRCADAFNVGAGTYIDSLAGADSDGDAACGSSSNSRDVYYRFTAPAAGVLTATTCGTNDSAGVDRGMDTVLSLHRSCPAAAFNQIDCNDDASGCAADSGLIRDSRLTYTMTQGEAVIVRVSHFGSAVANGRYVLTLSFEESTDDPADWNGDGNVNSQDFFDFLVAFFANQGDFNGDGTTNSQDFFDFLRCFFNPGSC